MDWLKIAGICTGIIVVLVPCAQFILKSYFEKAKELEKLKAQHVKTLLENFRVDINNLGSLVRSHRERMVSMEKTMISTQNAINNNENQINAITRVLDTALDTARSISDNMNDQVQKHVRTEVLKLKDHLIMIRNKRPDEGAPDGK